MDGPQDSMLRKAILRQEVEGLPLPVGSLVVLDFAPSYVHVHWPEKRQMFRFVSTEDGDYRETWEVIGVPEKEEYPNYLHPYYVDGFAFYGPHLYLDSLWLNRDGFGKLAEIAAMMGKDIKADFPHAQAFCKWFGSLYPDGIYLEDLKKAYGHPATAAV